MTCIRSSKAARGELFSISANKILHFHWCLGSQFLDKVKYLNKNNMKLCRKKWIFYHVNVVDNEVKEIQFYFLGSLLTSKTRPRKVAMLGAASTTIQRIFSVQFSS